MSANSGRLFKMSCEDEDEQRSPLGLTLDGRPVWPIRGAEDDDSDDDDSDDDDDDDDDTDSGGDKSKAKSKAKDKDDDGDDDALTEAEARAARYRERMRKADRRASEAERKLREAEDKAKGADGDEVTKEKLAESQKQVESLSEANQTLRLQNAFLLSNTHAWHDPADVMALVLKDEEVEIDEDGEVHGIESALKRIAKKKPWLIKAEKQDDDDDDEDEDDEDDDKPEARRRTNQSGAPQNRRRTKGGPDRQKLLQTYPSLRTR